MDRAKCGAYIAGGATSVSIFCEAVLNEDSQS